MADRPIGRQKNIGGSGGGVHRGGSAGTGGPVGGSFGGGSGGGMKRSGGSGGGSLLKLIIIVAILLLGGGGGIGSYLLGGSSDSGYSGGASDYSSQGQSSGSSFAGFYSASSDNSAWSCGNNTGKLNTDVYDGIRESYTKLRGGGNDKNVILVYMCGTDLESRSGMATRDMQEMAAATLSDNVRVIVYTGGCSAWKNNIVSSRVNQIYEIKNGGMSVVESDMGSKAMTDPATLSEFIKYVAANYSADRYDLILWDHGGGSKSGYGYDEKNKSSGSMSLAGIDKALSDGGLKYDFIGFDACLMATVETALVTADYADYLIASEETEPGVGWYYTTWLSELSRDPSMDTLTLGKSIIDTYTSAAASSARGQSTTLSLTDLREVSKAVPDKLAGFSKSTSKLIADGGYTEVSSARAGAREFASSSKIDQVDIIHLADLMGTDEAKGLRDAALSAVKYNRVSSDMVNSYGLSVYFPYKKMQNVDSMVRLYSSIGMDADYTKCIQDFAALEVGGQVAAQGSGSSYLSLSDILGSSQSLSGSSSYGSVDAISSLLTSFMSSDFSTIDGLNSTNTQFLSNSLDIDRASAYISENHLDGAALTWSDSDNGRVIDIPEEQWSYVKDLELSMLYDDGQGYLNLGLDNVFDFDDEGRLLAPSDRTWLAIDGQIVAYYHISTTGDENDYTIMGRVPVLLNGEYANLILVFDSGSPYGYVAGVTYDYREGETDTVAKNLTELSEGDTLRFICDGYDYDMNYEDTFMLGDAISVSDMGSLTITNENVGSGGVIVSYRFIDCYGQEYYTPLVNE